MTTRARVLLVEDDEVDYVITRKLLSQVPDRGYELEWAESFEEGLRVLEDSRPDVCLVDYRLGERSGLDLLRQAGRKGWAVPMILLTGQGDREVDAEALSLGAVAYLEKGRIGVQELDRTLRYALAREGLVTELIDQNDELLRLNRMTSALLSEAPLEKRMQSVVLEVAKGTGFPVVLLERLEPDGSGLTTASSCGLPEADRLPDPHPIAESPARGAIETRRLVLAMDVNGRTEEDRLWSWARSLVSLPMLDGDELVGAMTLATHEARAVDSTELGRAAAYANHLAVLLRVMHHAEPT